LQEKATGPVEDEHMYRLVNELRIPMALAAFGHADDAPGLVDQLKILVGHRFSCRVNSMGDLGYSIG
jgi:hypothetical protein